MNPASRRAALAQRMKKNELIAAPGVFELISAKIADRMGFECLYVTGYGLVASHLGLPDAGLATYSDMVGRVSQIAKMTQTPFIADADTGYGGLLNVQHTVRGYEEAGSCGIQLEDQEFPKKCGHTPGRRVIPAEEVDRFAVCAATSLCAPWCARRGLLPRRLCIPYSSVLDKACARKCGRCREFSTFQWTRR